MAKKRNRIVKISCMKSQDHYVHRIVIPKKVMENYGWEPGTRLEFHMRDVGLELTEVKDEQV